MQREIEHKQLIQHQSVSSQPPQLLQDALDMAAEIFTAKAFANLMTTLKLYVLSSFSFRGSAKTSLDAYPDKILLKDFISVAQSYLDAAIDQALEQGRNHQTLANNRSIFKKFMELLISQSWYVEFAKLQPIPRCAPRLRAKISLKKLREGKRSYGANPYALKKDELTDKLKKQLDDLHTFLTVKYVPARKGAPLRERTWDTNKERILRFLGWLKNEVKIDASELDITIMADRVFLDEFIAWQFERGNGHGNAVAFCSAAANIAKWYYGKNSKRSKFRDCDPVLDIREAQAQLVVGIDEDRRTTSKEALDEKLLELSQCEEIVVYLRECCSERTASGTVRSTSAIIKAWQNYLIIAGLTYTPVRQFEFTILELDKNLKRESDGWWVSLSSDKHKIGSKTKKGREYPLFSGAMKEQLTRDLDEYVSQIRPLANPKHNFLFFQRGNYRSFQAFGRPISDSGHLAGLVPRIMVRASALLFGEENAKRTSPHDFRRIFCTWLYIYGNAEEQEVYAEVMGHSVEQARRTYALVTSRDKTVRVDDIRRRLDERVIRMKAQYPRLNA